MVKTCDMVGSADLARRICEQFGIDMDRCASITVELLPTKPIKVNVTLLADKELKAIDWEGYLATAQTVEVECSK